MNDSNKSITDTGGTNVFKNRYQPIASFLKDANGDLLADSHKILNRWKNHLSQLLDERGVNDVMQTEKHTAEPLEPETSSSEVDIATANLNRNSLLVLTKFWQK
jgi:hypothetical protein